MAGHAAHDGRREDGRHHPGGRRRPRYGDALLPRTSPAWPGPTTSTPSGTPGPHDGVVDLALGPGQDASSTTASSGPIRRPIPRPIRPTTRSTICSSRRQTELLGGQHGLAGRIQPDQGDRVPGTIQPGGGGGRRRPPILASTYRAADDQIVYGIAEPGPRIVDFAPILKFDLIPLNDMLRALLKLCEETLGTDGRDRVRPDPRRKPAACRRASASSRSGRWSSRRPRSRSPRRSSRRHGVLVASESVLGNGAAGRDRRHRLRPSREASTSTTRETIAAELERDEPRARRRAHALPPHRLRPLGHLRPAGGHPRQLRADLRARRPSSSRPSRT